MKSKTNKKTKIKSELENSDKPIIDLNNSEIKSLLKKGKSTGYITHDQLNKALPDGELTSEQIEDVMVAINELGINIIDQNEESSSEEMMESLLEILLKMRVVVLMIQLGCTLKKWVP